ncbi:MAG: hypothetical protein A3K67_03235 [Euryarchaeota archaeon RBG_16_62_10]|nr:MAG: hypothetical protein A3K67_03235 [Euryarchaeota archaeon RBG_16_62_10]
MTESDRPSRVERAEKRVDRLMARASMSRKESIKRSMARPLRTELVRTGYVVGCVLIDLVLAPIVLANLLPDYWLYAAPLMLLLAYAQYRIHKRFFSLGDRSVPIASSPPAGPVDKGPRLEDIDAGPEN